MKVLIDISMDGYESAEHMRQAIIESLPELLDSSAITSKVLWAEDAADFDW